MDEPLIKLDEEEKIDKPNILKSKLITLKKYWWIFVIVFTVLVIFVSVVVISNVNHARDREKESQKAQEIAAQEQKQLQIEKDNREGRKPPLTSEELAIANTALGAGISIDDGQNDFAKMSSALQPDGRPDNVNPWPLPYTDLKNVQIGADNNYLYAKYQFYGLFPNDLFRNGDDFLAGVGVNFGLENYFNHNLGKVDSSALFQVGLAYASKNKDEDRLSESSSFFNPPKLGTSTFGEANPLVKDKDGEDTYGISSGEGKAFGGAGYDYIIVAFPLSNLGLQFGDEITFSLSTESGSRVFHHQSVDPLLDFGSAKMGRIVTWKIGSNSYQSKIPVF